MDTKRISALFILSAMAVTGFTANANAQMRITEWMYSGGGNEFVEFTNVGLTAIDMTGWSYDDSSEIPGELDLSAFGTVDPGESVIITEGDAAQFEIDWALSGIDVIGGYTNNLGRNDEINLYDGSDTLVDRLTFGDEDFPGSIRTQDQSGWVSFDGLGQNDVFEWTLSTASDYQNSYASLNGDIGSPGTHVVPEPATMALLAIGGLMVARRRRS